MRGSPRLADFASISNQEASKVPIYAARSPHSPAASLTANAVSGNGDSATLGSPFFNSMNPPGAYTITDGTQPAIALGPDYFLQSPSSRVATLIHEEFQCRNGFD